MRAILTQRIVCSNQVRKRAGVGLADHFLLPVITGLRGQAFEEAVKRRPGRIVTLRQKTRLLADSRRKN
jgi:hypothetical protein